MCTVKLDNLFFGRVLRSKDLSEITDLAQDRKRGRGLAPQIEKAAEMSQCL